jgi:hypothetical protein
MRALGRTAPGDADLPTVVPFYAADPEAAARGIDVRPAGSAGLADGLKPLAISQIAMTISCRASGAMKKPSESCGVVAELEEAAFPAEGVLTAFVGEGQALLASLGRIHRHPADRVLGRRDRSLLCHGVATSCPSATSQMPALTGASAFAARSASSAALMSG